MTTQLIGLVIMPVISRIYAPEAFGLASLFSNILIIPAIFTTMAYHNSIILPKDDNTALNMSLVCVVLTLIITGFTFIFISIGFNSIITIFKTQQLSNFIWLAPVLILLHGLSQTFRFWNVRFKSFKILSVSRVMENLVNRGFILSLGLFGYVTGGSIIYSSLIALITKTLILGYKWMEYIWKLKHHFSFHSLIAGAKRYRKFPTYTVWTELVARAPEIIITLLIVYYFNEKVLGYYVFSLLVLSVPSNLFLNSITDAFQPRAAIAKHEGGHVELLEKVYLRLVSITFFPFIIIVLFGQTFFIFIFGANWAEAGIMAQIIAVRMFFSIVFSPSFTLVNIMEKQELDLYKRLLIVMMVLVSMFIGGTYNDFYLALVLLTIFNCIITMGFGLYMMHIIEFPFMKVSKKLFYCYYSSFFLGFILIMFKLWIDINIILLLLLSFISIVIYYFIVIYFDNEVRGIVLGLFKTTKA